MVVTELARYKDSFGTEVELSIEEIKRTICPQATDQEAANFLHLCRYMGLNPFVRDAYLIKYGTAAASMVVGKDAFTKRADSHPQFAGMESGVIVQTSSNDLVNRKGTLVLPDETIVGGWARVARVDRKLDTDTTVAFNEFSTGQAMWKKMPGTMIEKVAIVKALRTAFPSTFSGLYDQAEMGIDMTEDMEPIADSRNTVEVEPVRASKRVKALQPDLATHADQPDPECGDCQADAAASNVTTLPRPAGPPPAPPAPKEDEPREIPDQGELNWCPLHGEVEWALPYEGGYGVITTTHQTEDGNRLCYFGQAYKDLFISTYAQMLGDNNQNGWLKERFDGRTLSRLSPQEILTAMELLTT